MTSSTVRKFWSLGGALLALVGLSQPAFAGGEVRRAAQQVAAQAGPGRWQGPDGTVAVSDGAGKIAVHTRRLDQELRHDYRVANGKLSHVGSAKIDWFRQANHVSFVMEQHRAVTGRFEKPAPVSLSMRLWGGEQEIVVRRDGTVHRTAYGDMRMGPVHRSIAKVAPEAAAHYVEQQHARLKAGEQTDAVAAFDELTKMHSLPSN